MIIWLKLQYISLRLPWVKSGWQIIACLYMYSCIEWNEAVTNFKTTLTLHRILPGVDFGHMLGNAFQETDQISFLSCFQIENIRFWAINDESSKAF